VYEPREVKYLKHCELELAFQFPLNVLDRRFERVSMPKSSKRYARSIFLQGLLTTQNGLRLDAPVELLNLQKEYHDRLAKHHVKAVGFAVSFVANNDALDYFLFGVDTEKQLQDILDLEPYELNDISILDALMEKTAEKWLDSRKWN
jgi:aryl-alcohol dehydrogenase-like predicted oxidoreductase